ncbi:MAG: hypothetical protein P4L33_10915 [Capsulimonadaceae bacterium]|nr:hypothetical protein [Capsulimonadaceae bacterium]
MLSEGIKDGFAAAGAVFEKGPANIILRQAKRSMPGDCGKAMYACGREIAFDRWFCGAG